MNLLSKLEDSGNNVCVSSNQLLAFFENYNLHSFSDFSTRSFYRWKSKERPIPITVVLKIMGENNINKLLIEEFSISSGNKISFPEDSDLRFGYLLGLILGDGCLTHRLRGARKHEYAMRLYINDLKKAQLCQKMIKKLFKIKPAIYAAKGCFALVTSSKPLVLILYNKYQIPIGLKYASIRVPELIINGSRDQKIVFLKGVFDSDGNLYNYKKTKAVQLRQKSERFLRELKSLFNEVGINFKDPYYDKANNSWVLWSSKKDLVDNFINKIIEFKVSPRSSAE
jgi:intein/homing endonuclease